MVEPIQILLIIFVLFALSRAYLRFSEGKIKLGEFVFWLILWVVAIIIIAVPQSINFISKFLGIGRAADLIIYTAIILLFYLIFRMYVAVDELEHNITKVVREVSIKRAKKK